MKNKRSAVQRSVGNATGRSRLRPVSLGLVSLFLLLLAMPITTHAIASISQSYSTDGKLPLGSIVSLQNNTADKVVFAASGNVNNLLGVVINAENSQLSLSNGQENQAHVITSGTVPVLVSSINGTIARGDHITASPISGVGMKATSNVRVIGIAQGELTDTTGTKESYTDSDGHNQTVTVGEVPVLVNVSDFFKEPEKTLVPSALQNVANALAGKSVSALPIIISAAIFLVMMVVVVSIIYSMIRSSIISVGRNPMSQSAIYRDLIQLSALVLAILAVGLIAIYLVLTRL